MQVLVEEHAHLFLVNVAHLLWRDSDLVAILVFAGLGDIVDVGDRGTFMVDDTEAGEVVGRNGAARVVVFALVTLEVEESDWVSIRVVGCGQYLLGRCQTSRPSFCIAFLDSVTWRADLSNEEGRVTEHRNERW